MNDTQLKKSEKIASTVLRVLAIVGLIAVLVLATWMVVQGSRLLPNAGDNVSAAISSVRSIFSTAPSESLVFEIEERTIPVNESVKIAWAYTGDEQPASYTFTYECGTDVALSVEGEYGWRDLACDTPQDIDGNEVMIIASSNQARFEDITLTIDSGELRDTTVVTVINSSISSIHVPNTTDESATSTTATTTTTANTNTAVAATTPTEVKTPTPTPAPKPTTVSQPVVKPQPIVVPLYTGPSDLVVEIVQTGVLVEIAGEDTFLPVSPIPSNKVGAVVFTVTNRGGVDSGSWAFKAELPTEGDRDYAYTSPIQSSLSSGMQVQYTLGFDEVLESSKGTIRIEIFPTNTADKKSNNIDAVIVQINDKS